MYQYRKSTKEEKEVLLKHRKLMGFPLHAPPHLYEVKGWFLISAATYEHKHYFTDDTKREFLLSELLKEVQNEEMRLSVYVILPNHYHILINCHSLKSLSEPLRRTHARVARKINKDDRNSGRKIWYRYSDRNIRNDRHYFTTLNYIHFNPIKHNYVDKVSDWSSSSIHWYLENKGQDWLIDIWKQYPLKDYGKGWDW